MSVSTTSPEAVNTESRKCRTCLGAGDQRLKIPGRDSRLDKTTSSEDIEMSFADIQQLQWTSDLDYFQIRTF